MQKPTAADTTRFWTKVDTSGGEDACWTWTAAVFKESGYGQFSLFRRPVLAHRASFLFAHGKMPTSFVLHTCDNRLCVNPRHLVAGDHAENMRQMVERGRWDSGDRAATISRGAKHYRKLRPETILRGEDVGGSVLSEADVLQMRELYAEELCSAKEIALRFGCGKNTVLRAVYGDTWAHVPNAVSRNAERGARLRVRSIPRGEAHAAAKLTADMVVEIRERHRSGEKLSELAARYGCSATQIKNIVLRRQWARVP